MNAAGHDAAALATLEKGMKTGAINASGNGVPDKATVDGLVAAFAAQSAGASNWNVERGKDRATSAEIITASIVRELPSAAAAGRAAGTEAAMYRLVLTCNAATRDGAMQVAWSPEAKRGTTRGCLRSAAGDELHGGGDRAHGQRHVSDHRTSSVRVRRDEERAASRFRRAR